MQSAFMQKLPDFIEYESKTTQNENSCLLPILSFNILPKAKFFSF